MSEGVKRPAEGERLGGCHCGALRYRVAGPSRHHAYCHCRSCRISAGAPFVAWTTFDDDSFRVLSGELREFASSPAVLRGFCPACGTSITYRHSGRVGDIDINLVTLDDASDIAPDHHVWVQDKLPWLEIGDGLPQHDGWKMPD